MKSATRLALLASAVHIIFTGNAAAETIAATPRATANAAETMILMTGDNWAAARNQVTASANPVMYKIYEWMLYREDYSNLPFAGIANFIDRNPHWPDQKALLSTAERNITSDTPSSTVTSWFDRHPPVSGKGAVALWRAASQNGTTAKAARIIDAAWADLDMTAEETASLLTVMRPHLSTAQQIKRLDKLLFADKYTLARSYAARLGSGYPELVEARIALAEEKPGAAALVGRVPPTLQSNTGLLYERLSWRRRHDEDRGAIEILDKQVNLTTAPNESDWWKERNILIRRMIELRDYKTAYRLASRNNLNDKAAKAEAEWMAGWLALRFLNNPKAAADHFNVMYQNVGTAISKSRGSYWSARAAEKLAQPDQANRWYTLAAGYPHTYYGQLAIKKINHPVPYPTAPIATPNERSAVSRSDLLQAALIARAAQLDTIHTKLVSALIETLQTPGEFISAAELLNRAGDIPASFRVAKAASWKNIYLEGLAFPSVEPSMLTIGGDHALYHAIIRQESQFDTDARSPSGALGLMQLMPATAKETAGKLGIPHQTGWLTSKPSHNIRLGSTYIDRLVNRFDNAYPLAIAGYNAGPNRVAKWLEEFGDPRKGEVDWIDWIELIPVSETRNYVQRVSENYYIYHEHLRMK